MATSTPPEKKTTSYDPVVVELRIKMHTNMDTQVDFTADMIENKKINGKYLSLCTNYLYSKTLLDQKTQDEIFDLFFDYSKVYNFALASKLKKTQEKPETKYDSAIVRSNIEMMLNALFPISFPIKDKVELKTGENADLLETAKNLAKPNKYTYLKLNKSSTITQVVWLNTISSNPNYFRLYKKRLSYKEKVLELTPESLFTEKILNEDERNSLSAVIRVYSTKIKETLFNPDGKFKKTSKTDNIDYILYFLTQSLKKNTKEYNDFIKNYVETFIETTSSSYYNRKTTEQYEKQFYDSVPEIGFYKKYLEDISELLPPKRTSLLTKPSINLANALKIAKDNNDFSAFMNLYQTQGNEYCDLIKLDNGAHEIHLGVAVVGGKVSETNYKFLCNYNSHRLGNDLNYLIKDIGNNSIEPGKNSEIRLYSYVDLENVKDPTEYIGVVNTSVKRKYVPDKKRGGKKSLRRRKRNKRRTHKLQTPLF